MHLVYRALEGDPVPLSLHGKVIPPSKRKLKLTSSAPSSPSPKGLTPPSVSSSSLSIAVSRPIIIFESLVLQETVVLDIWGGETLKLRVKQLDKRQISSIKR